MAHHWPAMTYAQAAAHFGLDMTKQPGTDETKGEAEIKRRVAAGTLHEPLASGPVPLVWVKDGPDRPSTEGPKGPEDKA